ncbi:MAG: hypothetical protein H7Y00_09520 [Fimbriimonadaceae bacterium]|nr:hypothetical protein [Chitinophagales bacterium]
MKRNYFSMALILLAVIFTSCSKEKQISKNLVSQSGRWNIDNYKIAVTTQLGSVTLPPIITEYSDVGYMNFFDNNDGQIFYIYDVGDYDYIEFEWTPEPDGVIIEYNNEEFDFIFTTNEKDRIVMSYSVTVPLSDTSYTTTENEYELLRIE